MTLCFRKATKADLPKLIELLYDDELGKNRESLDPEDFKLYEMAFDRIDQDLNACMVVGVMNKEIVATTQINFLRYLSHQGTQRAQIENVRVASCHRGQGIGKKLLAYVIQLTREHHCSIVQLTSNKQRTRAIKFYQDLGFITSHEGLKLTLSES